MRMTTYHVIRVIFNDEPDAIYYVSDAVTVTFTEDFPNAKGFTVARAAIEFAKDSVLPVDGAIYIEKIVVETEIVETIQNGKDMDECTKAYNEYVKKVEIADLEINRVVWEAAYKAAEDRHI